MSTPNQENNEQSQEKKELNTPAVSNLNALFSAFTKKKEAAANINKEQQDTDNKQTKN